jgi:imidazolonepropionase-like amidohydrolase
MNCVYAKTIYTGRCVESDAWLIFDKRHILEVLSEPKGNILGRFPIITPAFIDAHSHIGMIRAGEPHAESESNEHQESILALSDALDSVQMDDRSFQDAVEMGVLYSCVMPGSGNIIGGKSAVIRNYATNSSEALIARAGLKAAFGYNPMAVTQWKGLRPNTRMGALAILRNRLDEVLQKRRQYNRARGVKKDEIIFSAEDKVILEVLDKRNVLRVHVHKTDDIAALLRLVDEFQLDVTVEHAMDVHSPDIFAELKKRNIPVTFGPMDSFAYKVELKHENWRNIYHLIKSGVKFGIMSDHPVTPARQLFLQTRWFLRAGFTKQDAVELVSGKNAELLGIQQDLGTLEQGKWASFICWNGDPFHLTSYPEAVYGEGKLLYTSEKKGGTREKS